MMPLIGTLVLVAEEKKKEILDDPRFLWNVALMVGVFLLGAVVFSWLNRWRQRQLADDASPAENLTSFRRMYEQGEISKAEYDRIRARIAHRTKEKLGIAPPSIAAERSETSAEQGPAAPQPAPPTSPSSPGSTDPNGTLAKE